MPAMTEEAQTGQGRMTNGNGEQQESVVAADAQSDASAGVRTPLPTSAPTALPALAQSQQQKPSMTSLQPASQPPLLRRPQMPPTAATSHPYSSKLALTQQQQQQQKQQQQKASPRKQSRNATLLVSVLMVCIVSTVLLNYTSMQTIIRSAKVAEAFAVASSDSGNGGKVDIVTNATANPYSDPGDWLPPLPPDFFKRLFAELQPRMNQPRPSPKYLNDHRVAGLSCDAHGGPYNRSFLQEEMVYWRDIPSDAEYTSPYQSTTETKYLTFEGDEGGWNNIRMSIETATALAVSMGRTLVMPPRMKVYLLNKDQDNAKNRFSFADFYHFSSVANEHRGLNVITFEEFLEREMLPGNLKYKESGKVAYTPRKQTTFLPKQRSMGWHMWKWMRSVAETPIWSFDNCLVYFPKGPGLEGEQRGQQYWDQIAVGPKKTRARIRKLQGNPAPVDGTTTERMTELKAFRQDLCVYNKTLQDSKVVHFMGDNKSGARLLVHFYAYLFHEHWKQDLWTKRFIRDHLRYIDAIHCTAARIVHSLRQIAKANGNPDGKFDTFHIRRGDFQYKETRLSAEEIHNNIRSLLTPNATIFIATDEKDKSFFDLFRHHYHIYFLQDFQPLLFGMNPNYFGMLDQVVASKGRRFFGAFLSTFTGYIIRMRGYHELKDHTPGYEQGISESYFYTHAKDLNLNRQYEPIDRPMWAREFPIGWRLIDQDVEQFND